MDKKRGINTGGLSEYEIFKLKELKYDVNKYGVDRFGGVKVLKEILDLHNYNKGGRVGFETGGITQSLQEETLMAGGGDRGWRAQMQAEKIAIHHSWFVRSFENDYNPTHIHTNGSFSCVLYLKIPPGISDKNSRNTHEKYATEGYIDFVFGSSTTVCPGNMCVQQKVGDLYIFPAFLYHTVYPFYGEGERRSFSANMSLQKGD